MLNLFLWIYATVSCLTVCGIIAKEKFGPNFEWWHRMSAKEKFLFCFEWAFPVLFRSILWPITLPIVLNSWIVDRRRQEREAKRILEIKTRWALVCAEVHARIPNAISDEGEADALKQSLSELAQTEPRILRDAHFGRELLKEAFDNQHPQEDIDEACSRIKAARPQQFAMISPLERTDVATSRPWAFVMTKAFKKSIAKIDAKAKGQLLTALAEVCDDPLTVKGNTIKPLMRDLKDCWRYRLGNYRLIYLPEKKERTVVFLRFSPRGEVYCS